MAPGKGCETESPGFRRGLFGDRTAGSPGWKPGDSGHKHLPAIHAARLHVITRFKLAAHGKREGMRPGVPRLPPGAFCVSRRRLAMARHPGGQPTHSHAAAEGRAACMTYGNPRLPASVSFAGRRRLAMARHPGGQPTHSHAAAEGRAACLAIPQGVLRLDAASSRHAAAAQLRPRPPGGRPLARRGAPRLPSAEPRLPGPWMARQP